MRSLRFVAFLVTALPVLALSSAACEDSSSSSGGTFNPEGGTSFETGTGQVPEAGVDAFVPPATPGITVTVLDGTKPFADVRVIFHDATGAVIGDQKTDATGKVSSATTPDMVTVLASDRSGGGSTAAPITYLGVADGDKLLVVVPAAGANEPPLVGQYSVTLQPADGATVYDVQVNGAGCTGGANPLEGPVNVNLYEPCLVAQNNVVLATGYDGSVFGYGFAKNVAKPAAGATVNVGPLAMPAPGATTITAANLPAAQNGFVSSSLRAIVGSASFDLGFQGGSLSEGGAVYPSPTGFADAYQAAVYKRAASQIGDSQQALIRREATTAPASATLAFDFATALPAITNVTIDPTTPARPTMTVTSASPFAAADGGIVRIGWNTRVASASWTFVVPPTVTTFKAPALPADATAQQPMEGVRFENVVYFDASQLPGYKEAKTLPVLTRFDPLELLTKPLPSAGTLRLTRLVQGG